MHPFQGFVRRLIMLASCFAFAIAGATAAPTFRTLTRPVISANAAHPATTHAYKIVYRVPSGMSLGNLVALNGNLIAPAKTTGSGSPTNSLVEITPAGQARTIHNFGGEYGEADWLTADSGTNTIYGVSAFGAHGDGFVFSKVPGGLYGHVYAFPYDEESTLAGNARGPVLNINGTLNGTYYGGVYAISPSGTVTLNPFGYLAPTDVVPSGNVVTINGTLYVNTNAGESVYAISPTGAAAVIYNDPQTGGLPTTLNDFVVLNGMIYGVSEYGYGFTSGNYPEMVFQLNPLSGRMTVLAVVHVYTTGDGYEARNSGLILVNGAFYGTTQNVIYELTPTGTYSVIHTFADPVDNLPAIGETLTFANGLLYGTSNDTKSTQSVFSITP